MAKSVMDQREGRLLAADLTSYVYYFLIFSFWCFWVFRTGPSRRQVIVAGTLLTFVSHMVYVYMYTCAYSGMYAHVKRNK